MQRFFLLTLIVAAIATAAYAQFIYTFLDFPGGHNTTRPPNHQSGQATSCVLNVGILRSSVKESP